MPDADKLIVQIAGDVRGLKASLKEAQKELEGFTNDTSKEASKTGDIFKGVFSANIVYDWAKKAGDAVADFVKDSVKEFSEFESKSRAFFDVLGESANSTFKRMSKAAKGTASDLSLITSANRAMLLGIKENDLPVLLESSMKLGTAMGLSTTEAFDNITTGIGRQSRMILDNLGIMVNAEAAQQKYATALGKTTSELSEAEKNTAFYNEAMIQMITKSAVLTSQQDTLAFAQQRLSAATSNLKVAIGDRLAPSIKDATNAAADFVIGLTLVLESEEKLSKETPDVQKKVKEFKDELTPLALLGRTMANRWAEAVFMFKALGKAFGLLTGLSGIAELGQDASEGVNVFQSSLDSVLPITERYSADVLEAADSMKKLADTARVTQNFEPVRQGWADLNEKFKDTPELVDKINKAFTEMSAVTVDSTKKTEKEILKEDSIYQKLLSRKDSLTNKMEREQKVVRDLQYKMHDLSKEIEAQNHILKNYEDQLTKVQDKLNKLSTPVFTGQRAAEEQIYQLEKLIKQRELEKLGLEDDSAEYTSMQEEIDYLNKKLTELRLGYEIKYDDMRHQVEMTTQAHEDAKDSIYDSASQVIAALNNQWTAEKRLQDQILMQESVINATEASRQALEDQAYEISKSIDAISDSIKELDKLLEKRRALLMDTEGAAGGAGGQTRYFVHGQGYVSESEFNATNGNNWVPLSTSSNIATSLSNLTGNTYSSNLRTPGESTSAAISRLRSGGGSSSGGVGNPNVGTAGLQSFPTYQEGGYVKDTGLAMVHQGEYVSPRSETGGVGGRSLVINIGTINASNAREIAEKIAREVDSRISW